MKKFPFYGWLGLSILILAELLILKGNEVVATWFTPIMWSGYILIIDAIVRRLRGISRLSSNPREIPFLLLISVGMWLIFEAYNLHLKNWDYIGTPSNSILRDLGYFWSFATIMPGVFLTIDLFQIILFGVNTKPQWEHASIQDRRTSNIPILIGLLMLIIPVALPQNIAAYLFGLVWIAFIFLLESINRKIETYSITREWESEKYQTLVVVLIAGMVCGFIWETWNYQAFNAEGAYWIYTFPEPLRIFGWTYGMMPVLGLVGFPPFAWELLLMYEFMRKILGGDMRFGSRGIKTQPLA